MTDKLSPGYWLDIHFIRGKTRRLFYPTNYDNDDYFLHTINNELGVGVVLYTEDERPIRVYHKGVAAVEVVEFAAPQPPEASCDDAAETRN